MDWKQLRIRVAGAVFLALAFLAPAASNAETLIIGEIPGSPGGYCIPFGCDLGGSAMRFQQVYDADALIDASPVAIPEQILITQIDFFHAPARRSVF